MLVHTGTKPLLVISDSELAKEVLKTNHDVFSTKPANMANKRLTYNHSDITFGPASDHWKQMRRVLVNELLGPKRVTRFNQVLNVEIEGVLNILSSNPLSTRVNIDDMVLSLVYGVVCKLAFGKSYTEKPFKGVTVKQMLAESTSLLTGSFADMLPRYGWILDKLSGWNDRLEKCFGNFDAYFEMIIDKRLQTAAETSEDEKDFVDALIELSQKEPGLTKDEMKSILLDVLAGAIDTTISTLLWAMASIIKNPRVMQKLQTEIRSCVGSKPKVEASDLANMTYLKMVMKESLRVYPAAPMSFPRNCASHCQIGGYDVLPGTTVVINGWGIGRDPKNWKDRPNEFIPERFENIEVDFFGNHFEMLPFGGGRRVCPGVKFSSSIIEWTLANLLCWYDWEVGGGIKNEDLDMEEKGLILLRPKSPLCLVPIKHTNAKTSIP